MIERTYELLGEITLADIEFLTRAKVNFYLEPEEPCDLGYGLKVQMTAPKTFIIVVSDRKITWLKLNFGDRLLLIAENFKHKYY